MKLKQLPYDFLKIRGEGGGIGVQGPFGTFPKIPPFWRRHPSPKLKVSLKSREVTAERTKTNVNMEEVKEKQVESYKIWMKKQLDELREMYEKQKVDVAATMRDMYERKVQL